MAGNSCHCIFCLEEFAPGAGLCDNSRGYGSAADGPVEQDLQNRGLHQEGDSKMKFREFGSTGMRVSQITLGTWGMGDVGWDHYDESTRIDAIKAAIDCGVNLIDTAPAYNSGAAERLLGRALKKLDARDKIYISTKCGNIFVDGKVYRKDGSAATIRRQCEESLENLQTDHIDLMLIHWPDPNTPFEETMGTLNDLKKEGKILHIGVSNFSKEQIEEAGRFGQIEVIQPQYSMVYTMQEDLIRWTHSRGMGCMTYGSLGGGILTGKIRQAKEYDPTDSRNRFYKHFHEPMFSWAMKIVDVMDEISKEHDGVALSQIALNWSCQKDFVTTCIVGAQTTDKVLENCAAMDWSLRDDEVARLDEAVRAYSAQLPNPVC